VLRRRVIRGRRAVRGGIALAIADGQLSRRFLRVALGRCEGVGVVEVGTEGVGQQREELLTLARGEGQLRVDLGGEGAQYAFAGGRLHGGVLVSQSWAASDRSVVE